MARLRVLAALPLVALVLLAGGCGGDDDEDSATAWADDVCTAVKEWTGSLSDSLQSVQSVNPLTDPDGARDTLDSAAEDATDATRSFVDTLKDIGAPDTDSGDEAKQALDELGDSLREGVDELQQDIDDSSNVAGAFSAVANTLQTLQNEFVTTFSQLEQLDAQGELEDAFENADSCDSLT